MSDGGRASRLLDRDGRERVTAAVADAERRTSGEIVVAVASSTGRFERSEVLFAVLIGGLAVVAGWLLGQDVRPPSDWEPARPALGLLALGALFAGGALVGFALARGFPRVALALTSGRAIDRRVHRRAREAFDRLHVGRTAAGTGLVIFLAALERRVCVIADATVAREVPPAAWERIRDAVRAGVRQGRAADGLVEGVRLAGEVLAERVPLRAGDVNELTNAVHVLD